jgi:uncharacterized C2H2 Zn-finger protein
LLASLIKGLIIIIKRKKEIKVMFKCSMCGMEFKNVDEYVTHVSKCAEQYKIKESKKEEEELKKAKEINSFVETIKKYQSELDTTKSRFKEKYPKEYTLNFEIKSNDKKEEEDYYHFLGKINDKKYRDYNTFLDDLMSSWGLDKEDCHGRM